MHLSNLCFHCSKHLWNSSTWMLFSAFVEAAITSSKVSNRRPFKSLFIREKINVGRSQVRWVGGMGHKCHALWGQKLTNSQRSLCGSVVLVNEPFARSPQFRPCPLHPLPQSFQNPQVKLLVDRLTPGNELPVHHSLNVEETYQQFFYIWSHISDFFGPGWSRSLPLAWCLLAFRVITITPTFVTSYDPGQEFWVISMSWVTASRDFRWSSVSRRGTNFAATRLMPRSWVRMRWTELQLQLTPVTSDNWSMV